jgi:hypothetical protein
MREKGRERETGERHTEREREKLVCMLVYMSLFQVVTDDRFALLACLLNGWSYVSYRGDARSGGVSRCRVPGALGGQPAVHPADEVRCAGD